MGKKGKSTGTAKVPVRTVRAVPVWEREFDRWLDEMRNFGWPRLWGERSLRVTLPAVDVYEEKDAIVVKAEVPGLDKDEVEVQVSGSVLTIKGEKRKQEEVKDQHYYRSERSYGAFSRTLELPAEVKAEAATAVLKNGVLEIRLPRSEAARPRQIKVSVA